jgi:hypothetical protein
MRQLQLIAHGEPSDVIKLNTLAEPALGQEDVLISMEAAPLNPSECAIKLRIFIQWPCNHCMCSVPAADALANDGSGGTQPVGSRPTSRAVIVSGLAWRRGGVRNRWNI